MATLTDNEFVNTSKSIDTHHEHERRHVRTTRRLNQDRKTNAIYTHGYISHNQVMDVQTWTQHHHHHRHNNDDPNVHDTKTNETVPSEEPTVNINDDTLNNNKTDTSNANITILVNNIDVTTTSASIRQITIQPQHHSQWTIFFYLFKKSKTLF